MKSVVNTPTVLLERRWIIICILYIYLKPVDTFLHWVEKLKQTNCIVFLSRYNRFVQL